MKRFSTILIVCALFLTSCADPSSMYRINNMFVEKVEDMKFDSGALCTSIILSIDYANMSSKNITVENISGIVRSSSGKILARIKGPEEPTTVPKKSEAIVKVPLEVSFNNPLSIMTNIMQGNMGLFKDTSLEIELDVSAGIYHKHVKESDIAIDNFIKQFEAAPNDEL